MPQAVGRPVQLEERSDPPAPCNGIARRRAALELLRFAERARQKSDRLRWPGSTGSPLCGPALMRSLTGPVRIVTPAAMSATLIRTAHVLPQAGSRASFGCPMASWTRASARCSSCDSPSATVISFNVALPASGHSRQQRAIRRGLTLNPVKYEREDICIQLVGMRGRDAMRCALVDLERTVLEQLGRSYFRSLDGNDLVVVTARRRAPVPVPCSPAVSAPSPRRISTLTSMLAFNSA